MDSTHAAVAVGSAGGGVAITKITAALTTLLTGAHGLPADKAAAAAFLITSALGAIVAWVTWRMNQPIANPAPEPNPPAPHA